MAIPGTHRIPHSSVPKNGSYLTTNNNKTFQSSVQQKGGAPKGSVDKSNSQYATNNTQHPGLRPTRVTTSSLDNASQDLSYQFFSPQLLHEGVITKPSPLPHFMGHGAQRIQSCQWLVVLMRYKNYCLLYVLYDGQLASSHPTYKLSKIGLKC